MRSAAQPRPRPQGQGAQLCLHVGQLDVAPHFQAVDGGQVLQAVAVFQQVLTVHSHLEAVAFTCDPHLDRVCTPLRKSSNPNAGSRLPPSTCLPQA